MRRRNALPVVSFCLLLCACGLTSTTPDHTEIRTAAEITPQLDAVLKETASEFPGLAFALAGPAGIIWEGGTGYADITARTPFSARTPVSVYSVSKPMTAALALKMAEEGRLDLDKPIGGYVTVPAVFEDLTLRALLNHTAGLRHYREQEWLGLSKDTCASPREALAAFASDPISKDGGYHYSTFGYVVASHVIEEAGKEPFSALLEKRIFESSQMDAAYMWAPGLQRPPNGYERGWFGFKPAREIDNSCKFGGGGVIASANDLAKFGAALIAGRLLNDASLKDMMTPAQNSYGLGWGVAQYDDGMKVILHNGSAIGGTSTLMVDIDRGTAVAVTGNFDGPSLAPQAHAILSVAANSLSDPSQP